MSKVTREEALKDVGRLAIKRGNIKYYVIDTPQFVKLQKVFEAQASEIERLKEENELLNIGVPLVKHAQKVNIQNEKLKYKLNAIREVVKKARKDDRNYWIERINSILDKAND